MSKSEKQDHDSAVLDRQLAAIVGSYDTAYGIGVCEGLAKAATLAVELGSVTIGRAIASKGIELHGDRMREVMRLRGVRWLALDDGG